MSNVMHLNAEFNRLTEVLTQLRNEIVNLKDAGEIPADKIQQFEQATAELRELYKKLDPTEEFHFFAVTEEINYAATNWLKAPENIGPEITAHSTAFTMMGYVHSMLASKAVNIQALLATKSHAYKELFEMGQGQDRESGRILSEIPETALSYLIRKVNSALSFFQGKQPPLFQFDEASGTGYLLHDGMVVQPVDGITAVESLTNANNLLGKTRVNTDRVIVWDDHYRQFESSLHKSGRWSWVKGFFKSGAYEQTQMADDLRKMMADKGASNLSELFMPANINAGVPYKLDGEIKLAKGLCCGEFPSDAMTKFTGADQKIPVMTKKPDGKMEFSQYQAISELDDGQREAILALRQNQASESTSRHIFDETGRKQEEQKALSGTGVHPISAFLSGAGAGFTLQYGVEGFSKYYNEGKLPWNYRPAEWEEINNRAQKSAVLGGVSAVVHNYTLPKVAESLGTFKEMTPNRLYSQGLSNSYAAAGAGAIAGFVTHSLSSGYDYWKGELTGSELALDIADAAGRAIPGAVGSAVGHYLAPANVQIPILSSIAPVGGYLGSILGGVAGNMVYDTAKYYTFEGARKISRRSVRSGISQSYVPSSENENNIFAEAEQEEERTQEAEEMAISEIGAEKPEDEDRSSNPDEGVEA